MITKQKDPLFEGRLRWIAILSAIVLLLIAGLLIASHVVGIYHLTDSYTASDGSSVTDRYTIKKQNGVYALFDQKGVKMEQNQDGNYIAAGSGNQYTIDPESGDWALYAVVEYDKAGGESLSNARRILLFPQILQKNLASVKVQNASGSYEIYRETDGTPHFVGIDNPNVRFDEQKFIAFAVGAGYSVTMRKLDLSSDGIQRKADGSVNYASYGLEARYNDAGEQVFAPESYTVSAKDTSKEGYVADPDRTYTVIIGDKTLDGNGYYVRLAGRNAIYVMSSSVLDSTLRSSLESLVAANAVIPTTVTSYPMAQDFSLARMTLGSSLADMTLEPIVRFNYMDYTFRTNTLMEMRPYICTTELMEGYEIADGSATGALGRLHELTSPTCLHVGLGSGEGQIALLAEYGITGEIFYLSYYPMITLDDGSMGYSEEDFNLLFISQKTERGTYIVASFYYDMILEVDQYYLSFLEYEEKDWYTAYPVSEDISFLKSLSVEAGEDSYHLFIDNSLSYAYYIDEQGALQFPTLTGGSVQLLANGTYVYASNEGGRYTLYALDFDHPELYYDKNGNALLEPTINSNYMRFYSPEAGGELNYTVLQKTVTDLGEERYKTLNESDNFRYLWKRFLYFTVEGDIDRVAFEKLTGSSVENYLAERVAEDDADVTIRYLVSDNASSYLMNPYRYIDENGNAIKYFAKDNVKDIVLRFYCYSGQKALMTLELITEYDADGNPVEHPEKQVAKFCVQSDYLYSLVENTGRVVRGELVDDVK